MKTNKQLVINMVANLMSFGVTFGISFFLSPYIIESVGKEAYGFVSLSNDFVNYMALVTIALNSMANRFISLKIHQGQYDDAARYFNSVLIGNLCILAVLTVPAVVCVLYLDNFLNVAPDIVGDVKILFGLTFLTFFVSIISSTFSVAPYVKNRLDLAAVRDINATLVKAAVLIVLFFFCKPHINFVGIAGLVYTLVLLIRNIRYTRQLLPEIRVGVRSFDIRCIFEMVSAGIWNVVSKISAILATELSLLISNVAISDSAMGFLSIAKNFPNIVLQLIGVIASVFSPEFIISYAKNDTDTLNRQIQLSMKVVGAFAGIPITLLIVLGKPLLSLWVPSVDTDTLYLLMIVYGLGFVFAGPVETLYHVFTITNRVKVPSLYALVTGVLSIICVMIGLEIAPDDFTKMLVIMGTTTFFTIIRTTVFIPLYAAHCLHFSKFAFYPQIFKAVASVAVMSLIGDLVMPGVRISGWISLILVAMLVALVQVCVNLLLFFNAQERKELLVKFTRKR